MSFEYNVKYVAIYLRKSRAEQETELDKHRTVLIDLCNRNGFKFVEYAEIGTSDSIDMRPQMLKLLNDVEDNVYDAVCVVDYDRLGRGDLGEQDRIKKAFQSSETLIITPEKIYDLNNDLDDTYADFKGLFARQEYKMITKRLRQGKKVGSRRGDWTNGVPPFPYVYERYGEEYNPKGLVVNTDESSLYREIIESALNKLSPNKIAITLNQRGALTRKGNFWSGAIIQRLLLDETHLGKIISNKSQGNGHKNRNPNSKKLKMNPREEWVIVENCHEPVKTQEEHDKLAHMIKTRNLAPNRSMSQTYTLSGIVKCGKCGRFMTFGKDKRNKGRIIMKSCVRQDPLGNKCRNSGMWLDGFEELLLKEIRNFKDNFAIQEAEVSAVNTNLITNLIKEKETQSAKFKKALDVVNDGYELGDYSRDVWMDRKKKWTDKIRETENEIYELKKQLNDVPEISCELRRQNIEDFFKRIESPTSLISNAEKNDMYKSIIDHVVWIKSDGTVQIDIKYR